ncbi:MAG: hypothetical protein ACJAWV_002792 [Flammeovirgaceae bacterium]|jgi:hypothetical protein
MKNTLIYKYILSILLISSSLTSWAQEEKRRPAILPDYGILQYAGSIGAATIGGGYHLGKTDRWNLEFMYSYTPKYDGSKQLSAGTIKGFRSFFDSVTISQKHNIKWIPFRLGLGVNFIADSNFFSFKSDLPYESGYYWHRTGFRGLLFFQTEFSKSLKSKTFKEVSLYLEANIQDLYATMFVADKSFTAYDMIMLGVGTRLKFE